MALGVSTHLRYVKPDSTRLGTPPQYITSHPGQLSLLRSAKRGMSTGQSVAMLYSWGVKAGWLILFVDKCVGGR